MNSLSVLGWLPTLDKLGAQVSENQSDGGFQLFGLLPCLEDGRSATHSFISAVKFSGQLRAAILGGDFELRDYWGVTTGPSIK